MNETPLGSVDTPPQGLSLSPKCRGDLEMLTNNGIHGKIKTNNVKTYLYNRVSSGKQNKVNRDGLTRQSESAEVLDFLKKHKLTVVKTMEYIGSSFTGKNFDNDTVMGKFIEEVKSGREEGARGSGGPQEGRCAISESP